MSKITDFPVPTFGLSCLCSTPVWGPFVNEFSWAAGCDSWTNFGRFGLTMEACIIAIQASMVWPGVWRWWSPLSGLSITDKLSPVAWRYDARHRLRRWSTKIRYGITLMLTWLARIYNLWMPSTRGLAGYSDTRHAAQWYGASHDVSCWCDDEDEDKDDKDEVGRSLLGHLPPCACSNHDSYLWRQTQAAARLINDSRLSSLVH